MSFVVHAPTVRFGGRHAFVIVVTGCGGQTSVLASLGGAVPSMGGFASLGVG